MAGAGEIFLKDLKERLGVFESQETETDSLFARLTGENQQLQVQREVLENPASDLQHYLLLIKERESLEKRAKELPKRIVGMEAKIHSQELSRNACLEALQKYRSRKSKAEKLPPGRRQREILYLEAYHETLVKNVGVSFAELSGLTKEQNEIVSRLADIKGGLPAFHEPEKLEEELTVIIDRQNIIPRELERAQQKKKVLGVEIKKTKKQISKEQDRLEENERQTIIATNRTRRVNGDLYGKFVSIYLAFLLSAGINFLYCFGQRSDLCEAYFRQMFSVPKVDFYRKGTLLGLLVGATVFLLTLLNPQRTLGARSRDARRLAATTSFLGLPRLYNTFGMNSALEAGAGFATIYILTYLFPNLIPSLPDDQHRDSHSAGQEQSVRRSHKPSCNIRVSPRRRL